MATFAPVRSSFLPAVPQNFTDLGIPEGLVLDLMLRRMVIEGFSSMTGLSRSIRISLPIVDLVFKHMRQQQLVEIKGMSGNDYQFTLSGAGKQLASERFQVSQYAGACPVSLKEYHAATKAQTARINVDRRVLRQAFSDLVVSDKMLDQMGPAIISQTSIFVYGPTGNGKTSLAERMLRVYQDAVMIPYAVEVDNQIISVYDPVVHHPIDHSDEDVDPRWILCKRPCIVVGGELIPSMLELRLDESSGIYAAPLQM
jgi:Cdc6-like AAA superfamily ATPase